MLADLFLTLTLFSYFCGKLTHILERSGFVGKYNQEMVGIGSVDWYCRCGAAMERCILLFNTQSGFNSRTAGFDNRLNMSISKQPNANYNERIRYERPEHRSIGYDFV